MISDIIAVFIFGDEWHSGGVFSCSQDGSWGHFGEIHALKVFIE